MKKQGDIIEVTKEAAMADWKKEITELDLRMSMFDERVEGCKDCKTYLFCVKHQHEWVQIRYPKE